MFPSGCMSHWKKSPAVIPVMPQDQRHSGQFTLQHVFTVQKHAHDYLRSLCQPGPGGDMKMTTKMKSGLSPWRWTSSECLRKSLLPPSGGPGGLFHQR